MTGSRLPWLAEDLARLERDHLLRSRREFHRLPGGRIRIGSRTLLDFASNDYLGLSHHSDVIAAAGEALAEARLGSGASALVNGRSRWHSRLERTLAEFEREEDAILFPSGYAANVGTISALAGPDDVIFCDRLNHSSLVDGCRLSGAAFRVYRTDRIEQLAARLEAAGGFARRWIVTDGVFGMDGTVAPLAELCEIAERCDAHVIVDEAHGTGVLGEQGRGACERACVEHRVAVRIGTLSKAIASLGGFVAGSGKLIEFLWNRAKTHMFSTALPPPLCAGAESSVRIIASEPERRRHLTELGDRLRNRLREAGLDVCGDAGVPIVAIILGRPERAIRADTQLQERGFLTGMVRPPTVPRGKSRLRVSVSAAHSVADIESMAEALIEVCRS